MIRPILHPSGAIRWCTKAGITDVGMQAEAFVAKNPKYVEFSGECLEVGLTPIFEYVGPDNKIVLDYKEENLILLAYRDNTTGNYVGLASDVYYKIPNSKPTEIPKDDDEGKEGVVITFRGGHKVKVKTEWYVLRHRGKELIQNERKVVGMILDNTLDDVLPLVSHEQRETLDRFTREVLYKLVTWGVNLGRRGGAKQWRDIYDSRKDFALDPAMTLWWKGYVFKTYDDPAADAMEYVRSTLKKGLGSQKKYEDIKQKLKLPTLET